MFMRRVKYPGCRPKIFRRRPKFYVGAQSLDINTPRHLRPPSLALKTFKTTHRCYTFILPIMGPKKREKNQQEAAAATAATAEAEAAVVVVLQADDSDVANKTAKHIYGP
jgi:hypothetical protein